MKVQADPAGQWKSDRKIGSRSDRRAGRLWNEAMTSRCALHARAAERDDILTPRESRCGGRAPRTAAEDHAGAHFAYGALCGALLAAATPRPGKVTGAAAGTAVWLTSYMGWIPALNLLKPATEHPARRNALMIGVHLVWGASTAAALCELADARSTIFGPGPEPDIAPPAAR